MNKKILISILVLLILGLVGGGYYWYWQSGKASPGQSAETAGGGALPSLTTNPLENKPNLNPVDKTNPFQNIKTNPFE